MTTFRVGHGYDIHPFAEGRPMVLGGVTFDHPRGLLGHSDADALVHAICDALLGAAGLADIGVYFPNTDPAYCGVSSLVLLEKVTELIFEQGYVVENVDTSVIAEEPKIKKQVPEMRVKMQAILSKTGGPGDVNVKATTNEKLGSLGRAEGLAAHAVALIKK